MSHSSLPPVAFLLSGVIKKYYEITNVKICSAMPISLSLVSGLSGCGADSSRDGDGDGGRQVPSVFEIKTRWLPVLRYRAIERRAYFGLLRTKWSFVPLPSVRSPRPMTLIATPRESQSTILPVSAPVVGATGLLRSHRSCHVSGCGQRSIGCHYRHFEIRVRGSLARPEYRGRRWYLWIDQAIRHSGSLVVRSKPSSRRGRRRSILDIMAPAWADTVRSADLHNPGRFTAFVAYEFTSWSDDMGNLHRNVIFRDSDEVPAVPFSRVHSANPEDLWEWMDGLRERGIDSLAIPHNSMARTETCSGSLTGRKSLDTAYKSSAYATSR